MRPLKGHGARPRISVRAAACEQYIREHARRVGTGRLVGRAWLAHKMDVSERTISRYLRELLDAGRIEVHPPARVMTVKGWRTKGWNIVRMLFRRSTDWVPVIQGDTAVPSTFSVTGRPRSEGRTGRGFHVPGVRRGPRTSVGRKSSAPDLYPPVQVVHTPEERARQHAEMAAYMADVMARQAARG